MTVVVVFLGLSKHFNLPAAVTEIGRLVASQMGGYEVRRALQALMLLLFAVGLFLAVQSWVRQKAFLGIWERRCPEIICLLYLCGLFVVRSISLHQVGALLYAEVFGLRINWIVELTGVHALIVILMIRVLAKTSPET